MDTFRKLEDAYSSEPVRLVAPEVGHGVLTLAGSESILKLTTQDRIRGEDLETGWFDLVVQRADGRKILLKNSLTTRSSMPHIERSEWGLSIFPNIVVLDADKLLPSKKIRRLIFTAEALEDVFSYDVVEWQSLYHADDAVLDQLKALRNRKRPYRRSYDRFSPHEIYLVHDIPRVLRFTVAERTYEIFLGRTELAAKAQGVGPNGTDNTEEGFAAGTSNCTAVPAV